MRFLTVQEAALICRVSDFTIRRWIQAGTLPASKIGKRLLIPEEAVAQRLNVAQVATLDGR